MERSPSPVARNLYKRPTTWRKGALVGGILEICQGGVTGSMAAIVCCAV